MAKKGESRIDDLIIFIWSYVVIALPPLTILFLMKLFVPDAEFFADSAVTTLDFSTLVAVAIILPAIGSVLSIWRKKIKIIFFWNLEKQIKIGTVITALALSFALWYFYSVFAFLSYFGLVILCAFFLFYLPFTTTFLSSLNFDRLNLFIIPKKKMLKTEIIKRICYMVVVLLFIHSIVILGDSQIRIFIHSQQYNARHPQIINVEPYIVYYDTEIILKGRGFGWKGLIDTKFKYQNGIINISSWTDTKVIFTVPLHWKTGDITIWIQKPIEWDGKKITVNSNQVKLRLISRDDGWGKDDDDYFEQLNHLNKEALKLNGYIRK